MSLALGAEELREGAAHVGGLLFAFGRRRGAFGNGLGGVGDLVGAASADRACRLRFGEVGFHQAGQLGEAAQANDASGALEGVGLHPHRLEVVGLGGEAGRDHDAAAFRLLREGGQQLSVLVGLLAHSPTSFRTTRVNSCTPNAPSTSASILPSVPIAKSQGSLGRWKARTWGRTPLLGSLSL